MNKFNLSILVLLYGKKIEDSTTLQKILESKIDFINCNLIVWNNGPDKIDSSYLENFKNKGLKVEFVETLENESLAKIYNIFISMNQSNKYVLLDDDSVVNDAYFIDALNAENEHLSLPIIKVGGDVVGPKIDGSIYQPGIVSKEDSLIMAIGSGMVIGEGVINNISNYFDDIFDERFYLYGVDSSFLYRINKLRMGKSVFFINGFSHSLSRLEVESSGISRFRMIERANSRALICRFYSQSRYQSVFKFFRVTTSSLIKKIIKKKDPFGFSLSHFIRAYLTGKHYRMTENKKIHRINI